MLQQWNMPVQHLYLLWCNLHGKNWEKNLWLKSWKVAWMWVCLEWGLVHAGYGWAGPWKRPALLGSSGTMPSLMGLNSLRLHSRWPWTNHFLGADLEAFWLSSQPCKLFGIVLIVPQLAMLWWCVSTGNWVHLPEGLICSCRHVHQMW